MPAKKDYVSISLYVHMPKHIYFCVISKNCTDNLKLKILALGLDLLILSAYAQNVVLLLEPLGYTLYVVIVFTRGAVTKMVAIFIKIEI